MKISEVNVGFNKDIVFTIKVPLIERESLTDIFHAVETFNNGFDYTFILEKTKKTRSMDANAYMWVLCDKIAHVLNSTKEEVYRRAIKAVGVFTDVAVQDGEPCDQLIRTWGGNGIGYFAEMFDSTLFDIEGNPMKRVRLYKGSHTYEQPQLSRVIDWLVGEAKGLDLQVLTENKIREMEAQWNPRLKK